MNPAVASLIRTRSIAGINAGDPVSMVLDALGEPQGWVGKPPCYGKPIENYRDSAVWHYGSGIFGVRVKNGWVTGYVWFPDKPNITGFLDLPLDDQGSTCGEIVEWLAAEGIEHRQTEDRDRSSRIIASPSAEFLFAPYLDGQLVPLMDRQCVMLTVR